MAEQKWTNTQIGRFRELGLDAENIPCDYSTHEERNTIFQKLEKKQVKKLRGELSALLHQNHKTQMQILREQIVKALQERGFTRVYTPTVISKNALAKMTIDDGNPLNSQVFWLNEKQCLRPMLAPNLYSLMQDFCRMNKTPVRFFEIGSCFRKESQGASHSNEFTMLNIVEMGLSLQDRQGRLEEFAQLIMQTAGISNYTFESEDSAVYGSTLDVIAHPAALELASGAMGPHPLDAAWGVTESWVGMGFGLERLLMVSKNDNSIGKWARSISYLDGICLNI